jgi:hypothetical protein
VSAFIISSAWTPGRVDGEVRGPGLEELAPGAEIHVHELLGEVPAGLVVRAERRLHQARGPDRLGGGEHLLVGGRGLDAGLLEEVLADR